MRRSPILTNSGSSSSSSSSSPSTDEEGEGDDENNEYSALIKRFFIDEHASFRVAGNGAQLDDVPPSGSNPSLFLQDSVETRLGSLKFELEKEFQSNHHNDDSFEGLVRRFKIDPYSSNMRSPLPAAPTTRRSSVQPSPFPGHYSPPRSPSEAPVMTPFSPFSPWTPLDLSSLRARSHNASSSSSSRSRSRSVSRSRAAEDRSSQPVSSLDQVLHRRVRSGRVSRFPKKNRRQQQQKQPRSKKQQQQQSQSQEDKQTKPKVLHRNPNQFRGPRALFSSKASQKKKQQQQAQGKTQVMEQPQLPRPRKLELLQSTQRLMSIFRPPVPSSVW